MFQTPLTMPKRPRSWSSLGSRENMRLMDAVSNLHESAQKQLDLAGSHAQKGHRESVLKPCANY